LPTAIREAIGWKHIKEKFIYNENKLHEIHTTKFVGLEFMIIFAASTSL
jgi:hypothetical protein